MTASVDITNRTDAAAISLLVSFDTPVHTSAGSVTFRPEGFVLESGERKPRTFPTASGAIEVLRRITRSVRTPVSDTATAK